MIVTLMGVFAIALAAAWVIVQVTIICNMALPKKFKNDHLTEAGAFVKGGLAAVSYSREVEYGCEVETISWKRFSRAEHYYFFRDGRLKEVTVYRFLKECGYDSPELLRDFEEQAYVLLGETRRRFELRFGAVVPPGKATAA